MISGDPIELETEWLKRSDNFSAFGVTLAYTICYKKWTS